MGYKQFTEVFAFKQRASFEGVHRTAWFSAAFSLEEAALSLEESKLQQEQSYSNGNTEPASWSELRRVGKLGKDHWKRYMHRWRANIINLVEELK